MSERGYFSFRYAIPGYTLILLVVATNVFPLLEILRIIKMESAFGAFLAFLSLFTGSALGFFISQFWWWRFKKNKFVFGIKEHEQMLTVLMEKYQRLIVPKEIKEKKKVVSAVLDYIFLDEKKKAILKYTERRWDMYHVLSSTFHTLWIGLIAGILLRIYCEFFVFKPSFSFMVRETFWRNFEFLGNREFWWLLFIFLCVTALLVLFHKGRHELMSEYSPILEAFIRRNKVSQEELELVFPCYFPSNELDGKPKPQK